MIKILFFIDTTLASGGAEKVLKTLVNHMDQTQFDITVQTVWPEEADKYLVPGIRYKSVYRERTRLNRICFRLEAALGLTYAMHIKDDYDIEVAYLECAPTKIIASSTNKKAVKLAWVHCDLQKMVSDAGKFVRKARRWYKKYDQVVCVSDEVRQSYCQLFGNNPETIVLHNTVDDEEIRAKAMLSCPVAKRKKTAVAVGRLYKVKGYDRLLEAHNQLIREGLDYDLWILGEGPERETLEKMIRKYDLSDSVCLLGFQENPYTFIQTADFMVSSSRYEGFSTVVTEALVLGKTVVTTPCSGMEELLGDSEFGIITEDSVEGICKGIKAMLDSQGALDHYRKRAQERSKTFSLCMTLKKTEDYFAVMAERKQAMQ